MCVPNTMGLVQRLIVPVTIPINSFAASDGTDDRTKAKGHSQQTAGATNPDGDIMHTHAGQ